jgi:glycine dehydrogenase
MQNLPKNKLMKTDSFALRHLGPRKEEIEQILETIGINSLEELIQNTIPSHIQLEEPLDLPDPMSEYEFSTHIQKLAAKNNSR